jgi:hypothetical protein
MKALSELKYIRRFVSRNGIMKWAIRILKQEAIFRSHGSYPVNLKKQKSYQNIVV